MSRTPTDQDVAAAEQGALADDSAISQAQPPINRITTDAVPQANLAEVGVSKETHSILQRLGLRAYNRSELEDNVIDQVRRISQIRQEARNNQRATTPSAVCSTEVAGPPEKSHEATLTESASSQPAPRASPAPSPPAGREHGTPLSDDGHAFDPWASDDDATPDEVGGPGRAISPARAAAGRGTQVTAQTLRAGATMDDMRRLAESRWESLHGSQRGLVDAPPTTRTRGARSGVSLPVPWDNKPGRFGTIVGPYGTLPPSKDPHPHQGRGGASAQAQFARLKTMFDGPGESDDDEARGASAGSKAEQPVGELGQGSSSSVISSSPRKRRRLTRSLPIPRGRSSHNPAGASAPTITKTSQSTTTSNSASSLATSGRRRHRAHHTQPSRPRHRPRPRSEPWDGSIPPGLTERQQIAYITKMTAEDGGNDRSGGSEEGQGSESEESRSDDAVAMVIVHDESESESHFDRDSDDVADSPDDDASVHFPSDSSAASSSSSMSESEEVSVLGESSDDAGVQRRVRRERSDTEGEQEGEEEEEEEDELDRLPSYDDDGDTKVYCARVRTWRQTLAQAQADHVGNDESEGDEDEDNEEDDSVLLSYSAGHARAANDVILDSAGKVHESGSSTPPEPSLRLPQRLWAALLPHQRTAVQWLWALHQSQGGGILGDEMGLGKTIQVVALLAGLHYSGRLGPTLIVCPATVMRQWVREFHTWWPLLRVVLLHDSGILARRGYTRVSIMRDVITRGHVIITTYDTLRKAAPQFLKFAWSMIILDEGHAIRNPEAQVTIACKRFPTPHRLILSGAPIQNHLTELWSLFDFVQPGRLGPLPVFQAMFAVPITHGGYANASPLQVQTAYECAVVLREQIAPYLLRRLKKDVLTTLPTMEEQVLFCDLTPDQCSIYESFLKSREMDRVYKGQHHVLYAVDMLRKICNHTDLVLKDAHPDSLPEDFGHWSRSGKLCVVQQLLPIWKTQGHRALFFAQTRQMLDVIEAFVQRTNYPYLRMDGTTPINARMALIDRFNSDKRVFLFLLTSRVGGLGTNLTGADRVLIFDPDWNPATDIQARERAWRIGQTRPVTIYRLITHGTIEEKIYHRQIYKQFLTKKILQDPRQRRLFTPRDLHDLFALNPLTEYESFASSASAPVAPPPTSPSPPDEEEEEGGSDLATDSIPSDALGSSSAPAATQTHSHTHTQSHVDTPTQSMRRTGSGGDALTSQDEEQAHDAAIDGDGVGHLPLPLPLPAPARQTAPQTLSSIHLAVPTPARTPVPPVKRASSHTEIPSAKPLTRTGALFSHAQVSMEADVIQKYSGASRSAAAQSQQARPSTQVRSDWAQRKLEKRYAQAGQSALGMATTSQSESDTSSDELTLARYSKRKQRKKKHKHRYGAQRASLRQMLVPANDLPSAVASGRASDGAGASAGTAFHLGHVASVMRHDAIMGEARPEQQLIESESKRVAKEAVAALQQARALRDAQGYGVGIPSWTGKSGLAGAPSSTAAPSPQSTLAPLQTVAPSSATLLAGLKQRRGFGTPRSRGSRRTARQPANTRSLADTGSSLAAPSVHRGGVASTQAQRIAARLQRYLQAQPGQSAASDTLARHFSSVLKGHGDMAHTFRELLRSLATFDTANKVWKLKLDHQ